MSVLRVTTAAALVALFAAPAFAVDVPSDPVARCKGLLSLGDSPLKDAKVGSVEAIGDTGCKFTDIKFQEPNDPTVISVAEATMDKVDFASVYNGKPSNTMTGKVTGISVTGPEAEAFLGKDAKPFDLLVDYVLDPATKQFTLTEFALRGDTLGDLTLTGALDGINPDTAPNADPTQLLGTASLRAFKLHFENKGIIDRVLAFATAQGEDPKAAIEQGKSQAVLGMAALSAMGVPEVAVKSLMAFAQDFPALKGPLTISASPSTPVPFAQFATLKPGDAKSMELVKSLNVAVEY